MYKTLHYTQISSISYKTKTKNTAEGIYNEIYSCLCVCVLSVCGVCVCGVCVCTSVPVWCIHASTKFGKKHLPLNVSDI